MFLERALIIGALGVPLLCGFGGDILGIVLERFGLIEILALGPCELLAIVLGLLGDIVGDAGAGLGIGAWGERGAVADDGEDGEVLAGGDGGESDHARDDARLQAGVALGGDGDSEADHTADSPCDDAELDVGEVGDGGPNDGAEKTGDQAADGGAEEVHEEGPENEGVGGARRTRCDPPRRGGGKRGSESTGKGMKMHWESAFAFSGEWRWGLDRTAWPERGGRSRYTAGMMSVEQAWRRGGASVVVAMGLAAAVTVAVGLGGCGSTARPEGAGESRTASAMPPDDFWVSATVLGPVRTASATNALTRALRPGRYVVEPDRGLRAALGVGAMETSFPPQTRLLTRTEFAELWTLVNSAGLLDAGHPNVATGNGTIDPETIQGKTVYVLTAHANGRREMVILEVDPECGEWCGKAKGVVDWLGGKAWVKEGAGGDVR